MQNYKATIHIITPIIIHTGEFYYLELMPHPKKEDEVFVINPVLAYVSMTKQDQQKFDAIVDEMSRLKGDAVLPKMRQLRDFLHSKVIDNTDVIIQTAKALDGFTNELKNNVNAQIQMIYKESLTQKPYLPGSSVKGMIRTALLEQLRKSRNLQPKIDFQRDVRKGKILINASRNFEAVIMLGKNRLEVKDDPFKFLHVSDFTLNNPQTIFGTVRITSKKGKIPTYTEMTGCELFFKSSFYAQGVISIDDEHMKMFYKNQQSLQFFEKLYSPQNILGALKSFYEPLLKNNQKHPVSKEIISAMAAYEKNNCVPVRIGRFTQVESKTFKVQRTWERGADKMMNMQGGVTRAYVKGNIGAGWGMMSLQRM